MSKIKYCWNCGCEVPYIEYKNINFIPKCPKCGMNYPEKPKDEALLSIYQDEYLADRSDENLNKLFKLMSKVTFNVICHKLKCTSSHEDKEEIWDKVQWTMEKITKYYKEKPNFKIDSSFVQYIGQVVLFPLYNKEEQERKKKEFSIYSPKYSDGNDKGSKELQEYLSSDTDGGINEIENKLDYEINQNYIVAESISYLCAVIESLYEYEKEEHSNYEFRNSLYMITLYKYFIYGESSNKIMDEIKNSMDFKLIKKFEASKEMYKNILLKHMNGE